MDKGAFVSREEADSTTLRELLERYLEEVTPLKKGAEPETNRLRLMMRHPLARRFFIAGVRGVDIARWREERLRKVTPATVTRDLVLLGHVFEVARKERGIYVHNPVRNITLPPGSSRKGLNTIKVASITGHKDLRMLRRYTHLKAEDLARKLG